MQQRIFTILACLLFITGCASQIITKGSFLKLKDKKVAVVPFVNYTETPLAGLKAATVVQAVLVNRGYRARLLERKNNDWEEKLTLEDYLKKARKAGYQYLLTGSVQEWRYKTGIDGEPAVSYSVFVYDTSSGDLIYSAVGAKSGWGNSSLGVIAQELARELLKK